jgi:hypothetical protein
MNMKCILALLFIGLFRITAAGQEDDLLSLLEEDTATEIEYVKASFKTTRVINAPSLENTAMGVLDFKISHRFGYLNTGPRDFFGLDGASIRLGLDYGVFDWLTVGMGRSSFEKSYDGFVKWKFLRQSKGKRNMPFSAILFSSMQIKSLEWEDPKRKNLQTSRLSYSHMLIVGSKLTEGTSVQLMPAITHYNLVPSKEDANDIITLGIALRQKITKRLAINTEYHYLLSGQMSDIYVSSLSIGLDIETGGHVFQLFFTNSTGMNEKAYLTQTTGKWEQGDVRFGFNISRVFTVYRPKAE